MDDSDWRCLAHSPRSAERTGHPCSFSQSNAQTSVEVSLLEFAKSLDNLKHEPLSIRVQYIITSTVFPIVSQISITLLQFYKAAITNQPCDLKAYKPKTVLVQIEQFVQQIHQCSPTWNKRSSLRDADKENH